MQHTQENFKMLVGVVLAASFAVVTPSWAAGIVQPSAPDPILTGGPTGSCDPQSDSPDYVGGVDVNGNPVAQANLPGQTVPVPQHLEIPLKTARGSAPTYVSADGKSLAPLLNPQTSCAPKP